MSKLVISDIDKYYESLDAIREDGFSPVRCYSLIQFYTLRGRASVVSIENLVPQTYLQYVYFSPVENRYYWRTFPNYDLSELYLRKRLLDHARFELMEQLSDKVYSGYGVWLLFNKQQVRDMSAMLERVWNNGRAEKGKMQYADFVKLAELTIKLEDYKDVAKGLTGYKTACNQFNEQIMDLWKTMKPNISKSPTK